MWVEKQVNHMPQNIQRTVGWQVFFVSLVGEGSPETSVVFCSTCLFANTQAEQTGSKKADGQDRPASKQHQFSE